MTDIPPMQTSEKQAIFSIAVIYALRMLGLFMLVPILSLYAHSLKDATPILIGIALGCYGLTQAMLQIPFGILSDKYGRKPLIAIGLLIFVFGSVIAAVSHSIWGLILGRSLQGAGAVGSVTVALLADLTTEQQRTKAMAIIGITIGAAFSVAMVLGPLLNSWLSVPAIFWLTLVLALIALGVLQVWVPEPKKNPIVPSDGHVKIIIKNSKLLQLNFDMLFLHIILTANFVVLPFILQHTTNLPAQRQWEVYLPALLLTLFTIAPILRWIRTAANQRGTFLFAIGVLCLAELSLRQFQTNALEIIFGLWIFFTAFTLLEAMIPSAVAQIAPLFVRGAAMGVNATFQFFGIFLGGTLAGWMLGHFQLNTVLLTAALLAAIWGVGSFIFQISIDIHKLQE